MNRSNILCKYESCRDSLFNGFPRLYSWFLSSLFIVRVPFSYYSVLIRDPNNKKGQKGTTQGPSIGLLKSSGMISIIMSACGAHKLYNHIPNPQPETQAPNELPRYLGTWVLNRRPPSSQPHGAMLLKKNVYGLRECSITLLRQAPVLNS